MITIKLPYKSENEELFNALSTLQREQSSIVRFAFNCYHKRGLKELSIRNKVKNLENINNIDSWFIQCAIKDAKALHQRYKDKKKVVFGGRKNLNDYLNNKKTKEEFKEKRLLPLVSQGEAPKKGNRKFTLDIIENNQIIFKPKCKEKYILQLPKLKPNYKKQLCYLEELSKQKKQPYSIRLTKNYISISFEEIKIQEQNIGNRVIAIDLNPNNIGYSICDYSSDEQKIIDVGIIEYRDLNKKLCLASENIKQKKQNNKREYEQYHVVKFIINKALHYKCEKFIIEGLSKLGGNTGKGKAFNRLINNVWNRNLFKRSLKKHCNSFGIKFVDVNPCYSSIIGNIIYNQYPDPACASLEINRRGQYKFQKDKFYPKVPSVENLNELWKQTLDKSFESWKELSAWLNNSKMRYRIPLNESSKSFSYKSSKSSINLYEFECL